MDEIPTKQCSICNRILPYYEFRKNARCKYGVTNQCKVCTAAKQRQQWAENPEKYRQMTRAKTSKNPEKYLANQTRYRNNNREHYNQLQLKHYYKNREKRIETAQFYRKKNAERNLLLSKIRRQKHPEKIVQYLNTRRARKLSKPSTFTTTEWQFCLSYWHNSCAYCGALPNGTRKRRLCAEHVIPLTDPDCPGTVATNIVVACASCNSSKGKKKLTAWLNKQFGPAKAIEILNNITAYFETINR